MEFLVSEMARCRDMGDARVRSAGVLQHFERFVKVRSKDEVGGVCVCCVCVCLVVACVCC